MANLRLKMVVQSVRRNADATGEISSEEISLNCVYDDGGPNKQWSKWTPNGNMTFTVSNPLAFGKVLPGQFYMVDMSVTTKDSM